ncbi:hypothetical protein J28TS4_01500 [Paenibacillus lautus]|nr:hypothetical protein J28TS4_01500 [Paenibacillus lautus]
MEKSMSEVFPPWNKTYKRHRHHTANIAASLDGCMPFKNNETARRMPISPSEQAL